MEFPMSRFFLALLSLIFLSPADISAQCTTSTCTADGGVPIPAGWELSLPFPDGENVRVLSGYGPTTGSSLHCRSQDGSCANDWFALDLVLPDHPNFGKGQPVLAIADGEVISAGWGTAGWANYGRRVYLRHTVGGTAYTSMYAHLDSVAVSNGDRVTKGQRLGTLGGSCQEQDACASFSTPHLHFSIHRGASFGGSGSGGSYGGRAVIPEPMDGYTGIQRNQVLVSRNGSTPPPPPVECEDLVSTTREVLLEEDGPCAMQVGAPQSASIGSGNHAFTIPLAHPSPDYANGVVWILKAEQAGDYEVWANIPAIGNQAGESTYKIQYAGEASELVVVDQAAHAGGEVRLGRFALDTTSNQWIRLGDNFSDAANQNKAVVLDSIRVFSADICTCQSPGVFSQPCEGGLERVIDCNGCIASIVSECAAADPNNPDPEPTPNNPNNPNNQNQDPTQPNPEEPEPAGPMIITADGGCGSIQAGTSIVSILALFGLVGILRRRW